MEIIKFSYNGRCLTNCPYNDDDSLGTVKVGSWKCLGCLGFVSVDKVNQKVKCKFDEILAAEKKSK